MPLLARILACLAIAVSPVTAADFDEAVGLFTTGDYEAAAAIADAEVQRGIWSSRWSQLLIQCQMETGQFAAAGVTYQAAIRRYPTSVLLRRTGLDVLRVNGRLDEAAQAEQELVLTVQRGLRGYLSREDLIAAGRYLTDEGEDARKVLQLFYDRVRERDPDYLEGYIATAELAIAKGDFAVASETLADAARLGQPDPRIDYLLALATASSDPPASAAALQRALATNPRHAASLLLLAENAIDRERYDEASAILRRVLQTNLHEPSAWSLLAVIEHVRGRFGNEAIHRAAALSTWSTNPAVDHLIGKKLSQKYRFAEGAAAQNRALTLAPDFTAAQFQLAQDLLRLGDETIGWQLAEDASTADPYNVVAYNLLTLRDRVQSYPILERDGIRVRMASEESVIYGSDVLDLLCQAKSVLCAKYDVTLDQPITVEIYPKQADFAIRTFGLPGGAGFLGVCFGRVITANSPASQGERPSNWQSVLWHEFAHVVTLEKTRNRMPRWLSEGISVYEERQRDPSWGQSINATYRAMILGDDLTPVSDLSSAFLQPKSPLHLQFAYYESSLVVQHIIDNHGAPALLAVLDDLAAGLSINDALTRQIGSIEKLDVRFREAARDLAGAFGPAVDWSRDDVPPAEDVDGLRGYARIHGTNHLALTRSAAAEMREKNWDAAVTPLRQLMLMGVATAERSGPLEQLAQVYGELGDEGAQRRVLTDLVRQSSDALPALRRLIELDRADQDWPAVHRWATAALAVQPLLPEFHRALADASEQIGRTGDRVDALTTLLAMDPQDPAGLHYELADAHAANENPAQAKHHVMRSLEIAPRYRDAHRLLLRLVSDDR